MKFSAKTAFDDLTPYQGHLWSIHFPGTTHFNAFNAGGSVGKEFPATTVQEDLFSVNYDQLVFGNGIALPVPQFVLYLGNLNITFWDKMTDNDVLLLEKFFVDWVQDIHEHNAFKKLGSNETVAKLIEIRKYNKTQTDIIRKSKYLVLPPDVLMFNPTGMSDLYTNTVRLPIIGTKAIHDK